MMNKSGNKSRGITPQTRQISTRIFIYSADFLSSTRQTFKIFTFDHGPQRTHRKDFIDLQPFSPSAFTVARFPKF